MDKKVFYDVFNDRAEEFFKDLITSFPNVAQFKTFHAALKMMRNLDVKKPQQVFNNYVVNKYRTQIANKDETFFLTNTLNVSGEALHEEAWEDFIEHLRCIWKELDETNKSTIWKYFQVLILLNDKCLNTT